MLCGVSQCVVDRGQIPLAVGGLPVDLRQALTPALPEERLGGLMGARPLRVFADLAHASVLATAADRFRVRPSSSPVLIPGSLTDESRLERPPAPHADGRG